MGGCADQEGSTLTSMEIDELLAKLESKPRGESVCVAKSEMPELPPDFRRTMLGTPLWIAHPGAVAQYRAPPALHAYELDTEWKIHQDCHDPKTDPVGHFFIDAPELPLATACAGIAGLLTYSYFEGRESDKPEEERNPWVPLAIAVGVAFAVGVIVYIVAALTRVVLSMG